MSLRQSRADLHRLQAAQRELSRAEEDYQRFRAAYLALAQQEHGQEVALAMVGADMDRAHANLQHLAGLRPLPSTREATPPARHEVRRMAEQSS